MDKILYIVSRIPYPIVGGREKIINDNLSFLNDLNKESYIIFFIKENKKENLFYRDKLSEIYKNLKFYDFIYLPNFLEICFNILYYSIIKRTKSLQECFYFKRKNIKIIQNFIKKLKPDVVIFDLLRTSQYYEYIKNKDFNVIVDIDDLLSNRYKQLINTRNINILGNISKYFPKLLLFFINNMYNKFILRLEYKLLQKREYLAPFIFDKVLLVSPIESEILKSYTKCDNIYYKYPAVKIKSCYNNNKFKNSLSFMGLLNAPHNENGLIIFFETVFPELIKKINNVNFFIIGANATENIIKYAKMYKENVCLLNYVDDYKKIIVSTEIFISPIFIGTGIKTKIIEVMALNVPIITTEVGVQGLLVEDKKDILIAKNNVEFLNYIILLLENKELSKQISENGYNYVKKYHDYEKIKKDFYNLLGI